MENARSIFNTVNQIAKDCTFIPEDSDNLEPDQLIITGKHFTLSVVERVDDIEGTITLEIALPEEQDNKEDIEWIAGNKFKFLQLLEDMAFTLIAETRNDDACSYRYEFDSDHGGDNPKFIVQVTDSFS